MGRIPEDAYLQYKGYRLLIVKSYIVFYVVFEEAREIEIRRITHGKRRHQFLL